MRLVKAVCTQPFQFIEDIPEARDLGFRLEIIGDLLLVEYLAENCPDALIILVFPGLYNAEVKLVRVHDGVLEDDL